MRHGQCQKMQGCNVLNLKVARSTGTGLWGSGAPQRTLYQVPPLRRGAVPGRQVRVLFATGTLAQGLNMPARTVVFDGDSQFLNPMTYQQMAGRAGVPPFRNPDPSIFGHNVTFANVCMGMLQTLIEYTSLAGNG